MWSAGKHNLTSLLWTAFSMINPISSEEITENLVGEIIK
jgi:hypothetical protein